MKKRKSIEKPYLKLSLIINLFSSFFCILLGLHDNSAAVIFDGFYCLFLALCSFFLILMSNKLNGPPDKSFQFGYAKFEPLMVFIQAAIIVLSCAYASLSAVRDLIHHHQVKGFGSLAILQSFLFLISSSMSYVCQFQAKKHNNRVLKIQGLSWYADAIQSILLTISFLLGFYSKQLYIEKVVPYIDPIALIFLVVSVVREPLRILKLSLMELLDGIHPGHYNADIEHALKKFFQKHPLKYKDFMIRKAGMNIYVQVSCSPNDKMNLVDLANVQNQLNEYMNHSLYQYHFDVIIVMHQA
jgi:cation diffusion facilitator family transporter